MASTNDFYMLLCFLKPCGRCFKSVLRLTSELPAVHVEKPDLSHFPSSGVASDRPRMQFSVWRAISGPERDGRPPLPERRRCGARRSTAKKRDGAMGRPGAWRETGSGVIMNKCHPGRDSRVQ